MTTQHADITLNQKELKDKYGGFWGEHPEFPVSEWKAEIENDDTRQGYWYWVEAQIEQWEPEDDEEEETNGPASA